MSFDGKVALIYGAGGGMGLNIANDLLRSGAHVFLADLKPEPADIVNTGGNAEYHRGDATDEAFVKHVTDTARKTHGRVDYLVNTTGVLWFDRDCSLMDIDLDVWDRVLEVNLKSFVLTSRHAIEAMKQGGGGALVHLASVDALRGDGKPQDAYGASKAAVIRLSKSIAIQFAEHNIRSNTVLPGAVMSPMQARWQRKHDVQQQVAASVPLGRIGETQDIANACLFLLSEKASYITGTELVVDGGVTALP